MKPIDKPVKQVCITGITRIVPCPCGGVTVECINTSGERVEIHYSPKAYQFVTWTPTVEEKHCG